MAFVTSAAGDSRRLKPESAKSTKKAVRYLILLSSGITGSERKAGNLNAKLSRAIATYNREDGTGQQVNVEPERPVPNIVGIVTHLVL